MKQSYFIILTIRTRDVWNHDRLKWLLNRVLSFSQYVYAMYETTTDYNQCGARSGSPQKQDIYRYNWHFAHFYHSTHLLNTFTRGHLTPYDHLTGPICSYTLSIHHLLLATFSMWDAIFKLLKQKWAASFNYSGGVWLQNMALVLMDNIHMVHINLLCMIANRTETLSCVYKSWTCLLSAFPIKTQQNSWRILCGHRAISGSL